LAGVLIGAAVCLAFAACSDDGDAASHVSITECQGTEGGTAPNVSAVVKIENKGSNPASYQALITFASPDGSRQMGSGIARASGLAPGQSTSDRVHGEIFGGPLEYECEVAEVERVE
jgi:hypothetical protein